MSIASAPHPAAPPPPAEPSDSAPAGTPAETLSDPMSPELTGAALSRAQKAARRHSGRVRRLRVLLPVIGGVLALLLVGALLVPSFLTGMDVASLGVTREGVVMETPRLSGTDGKGNSYEVTAEKALQSFSNPTLVQLENIVAHINLGSDGTADFTAKSGTYDTVGEHLVLDDGLKVNSSQGYDANLTRVEIDLKSGGATVTSPIEITSERGSLKAKGARLDDKAGVVTFTGGVSLTLIPAAPSEETTP
ncbi:LPS export ABC transporter periplasmic protein LptC [Segnochrobactraceae bacterium EtOH-i3]